LVMEQLKITDDQYSDELSIGDIPEWDSAAHVNLITSIEERFEIDLDISDAIDIEDVFDIIATLKKYNVT